MVNNVELDAKVEMVLPLSPHVVVQTTKRRGGRPREVDRRVNKFRVREWSSLVEWFLQVVKCQAVAGDEDNRLRMWSAVRRWC